MYSYVLGRWKLTTTLLEANRFFSGACCGSIVVFTGNLGGRRVPNDSCASALCKCRLVEALDIIPAPTSPRRLECDLVSYTAQ